MVINNDAIKAASEKVFTLNCEKSRRDNLVKMIVEDIKRYNVNAMVRKFATGRDYYYMLESVDNQKLNMVLAKY